jgi:hypothetical protein
LPEIVSDDIVNKLASLSKIILFSAAIPFQGGTEHQNEQWQSYWALKFRKIDYIPVDCIRPKIWDNPNVAYWYAQNILLYLHKDIINKYKTLKYLIQEEIILNCVHFENYRKKCEKIYLLKSKKNFIRKIFLR